jgi:hypothetical protein
MVVLARAMTDTGGVWYCPTTGKVEMSTVPRAFQANVSADDRGGYYSVRQLNGWIETLTQKVGMREEFLVPAIVRSIEAELDELAFVRATGFARRRFQGEIGAVTGEPAHWRQLLEEINRPSAIDNRLERSTPLSDADVQATIDVWTVQDQAAEDARNWRIVLEVWQELTAPILGERHSSA